MRGTASACGSATVINAISTGQGAAFAINLRVHADVNLLEGEDSVSGQVGDTSEDSLLIETCVEKVLEFFEVGEDYGANVKTTVDLPIAVGLSSSSAAANATVLATSIALGEELEPEQAINLGIEAAFEAGTTITGAYDDAAASFYGGGVITDNEERSLVERFSIDPSLSVLVFLPPEKSYTVEIDVERTKLISELVSYAYEEALSGNPYGAQTLNGLLYSSVFEYSPQPALDALDAGAICAGLTGTGPAVVALCEDKNVGKVKKKWEEKASKIIVTSPSEEGVRKEDE